MYVCMYVYTHFVQKLLGIHVDKKFHEQTNNN